MNENLKYIAKLSASAASSFLKINILGAFSTVIVIILEFTILIKGIDAGHSAHASAIPFLLMMFFARPVGSVLWYLTCLASPYVFFLFGNQYIISKITNKVITDKSESLIIPILDRVLNKFQAKQPNVLRNTGDYSMNKLKIIQAIRNDKSENKWLRKIIVFGMKKVKMDGIDFTQENLNFYDIIKVKTIQTLKNISEPSRNMIWITIGAQWAILLFIWLTKF
ncbi:MAG: hypothetical protein E2600_11815 [Chryseobacterium sp.]|nr:hypothetical protein [Chryseobacterium sp.]